MKVTKQSILKLIPAVILMSVVQTAALAQMEIPTGLTPAGVFTVQPTPSAFTTTASPSTRYIESGAGFLWFQDEFRDWGPAIVFNQLLTIEPDENREDVDSEAFFAQDGIGLFDPSEAGFFTATIEDWASITETTIALGSLVGIPFSASPLGRDTIPRFTRDLLPPDDPTVDHVEYVETDWNQQQVDEAIQFLQDTNLIDDEGAAELARQFFPATTPGDFDGDTVLAIEDLNRLSEEIAINTADSRFDLDRSGSVDLDDRSFWITELKSTTFGDTNLDGEVEFSDFLALSANFGKEGGWAEGDFDGNGQVAFPDFLALSANFGQSVPAAAAVPEPTASLMAAFAMMGLFGFRQRRWTTADSGQLPTCSLRAETGSASRTSQYSTERLRNWYLETSRCPSPRCRNRQAMIGFRKRR